MIHHFDAYKRALIDSLPLTGVERQEEVDYDFSDDEDDDEDEDKKMQEDEDKESDAEEDDAMDDDEVKDDAEVPKDDDTKTVKKAAGLSSLPKLANASLEQYSADSIKNDISVLEKERDTLAKNANMGAIAEYRKKEADYLSR